MGELGERGILFMETEIIEKELSYRIMKAAFEVYNQLGPGYGESIYTEAMALELKVQGVSIERQKHIVVKYKGQVIGEHYLDALAEGRVILEYKAVAELAQVHKLQALSYLKTTGLPLAIVINFAAARLQSSRVVHTKQKLSGPKSSPESPRNQA
jgi:GxxExxY protein